MYAIRSYYAEPAIPGGYRGGTDSLDEQAVFEKLRCDRHRPLRFADSYRKDLRSTATKVHSGALQGSSQNSAIPPQRGTQVPSFPGFDDIECGKGRCRGCRGKACRESYNFV